jgi:hypothetical protein
MGLSVQGTIPDSTDVGLNVIKKIKTGTGFIGNGTKVTNTCGNTDRTLSPSAANSNGETALKQKLGTGISITTLKATIKNGRPTFGTQAVSFSYVMPTASDIPYTLANGKKTTVAAELASLASSISALKTAQANFATKTALKGKADKNHKHNF